MKKSERLVSLLIILAFGLLIAYLMGQKDNIPWKKTLGCPHYSVFKQGLINFQFVVANSVTQAIHTILNLFDRAENVIF